jgi:hypothetical protein
MASNRIIRPVIVTCFLSTAVLLGGCSPPLPKTWLPLPGGTIYDSHMSSDRWHEMTGSPLTTRR